MESIQRELSVITSIKTHHTKIAKELELVEPKVDNLETNVKIQLNKLQELIESTQGSDD